MGNSDVVTEMTPKTGFFFLMHDGQSRSASPGILPPQGHILKQHINNILFEERRK